MNYITFFDIFLNKEVYYCGETVSGYVLIKNFKPLKLVGVRCFLRGKAKVRWKTLKSGETRILKDNQYLIDEKKIIFGKDKHNYETYEFLFKGVHKFNFDFELPQNQQFPCSLETKYGTVRYYIKIIIDIANSNSPQGIKYFSFIGPHIDCMADKYLSLLCGQDHKVQGLRYCQKGMIALRVVLDRTAYICGENLRLQAYVENWQYTTICLCIKVFQHIEYRIETRNISEKKHLTSTVLEYRTPTVTKNSQTKFNSINFEPLILIPVVPPTIIGVCRLMQIYYVLQVFVENEKKNKTLQLDFPLIIGTIPYRNAQSQIYSVTYDFSVDYVESGKYISSVFQCDNVGNNNFFSDCVNKKENVLYRPVYVKAIDTSFSKKENN